ncbi:hypothetical protein AWB67_03610 [Caballeronia terrestris]|uniref:Uncharacterized protein n=1 Tax=Caballeronia terrestris TaxID=1226301 RepID=A0A158JAR6_9BURK|nr:hypothetical protein AWB67_03610 [Caballeronia terrestris]
MEPTSFMRHEGEAYVNVTAARFLGTMRDPCFGEKMER